MAPRPGWLPFRDRREAGRLLAEELSRYRGAASGLVLGLTCSGVPVAAEVAAALDLPLEVVIARRLRAPCNPELAIGAVAEGGIEHVDADAVVLTGATPAYVDVEIARRRREIAAQQTRFRDGHAPDAPQQATAILCDDGISTGSKVIAAIRAVRALHPARLVLAVPVAPADTAERLRPLVDELVVLATPQPFYAVGVFYQHFPLVTDDDVVAVLDAWQVARGPTRRAG